MPFDYFRRLRCSSDATLRRLRCLSLMLMLPLIFAVFDTIFAMPPLRYAFAAAACLPRLLARVVAMRYFRHRSAASAREYAMPPLRTSARGYMRTRMVI